MLAAPYVVASVGYAWALGGSVAAAIAAALVGVSPFARRSGMLVLSDAFAAAGTVLTALLLVRPTAWRISVAGALTGVLVSVRLGMIVNLAGLCLALPIRRWPRALGFALPAIAGLGLYNWHAFGNPFRTGYHYLDPARVQFSWARAISAPPQGDGPWIVSDVLGGALFRWYCPCPFGDPQAALPNILFYPSLLLGLFWVFAPPLSTLPGLWYAWRQRRKPAAAFTLWVSAFTLGLYTLYFYQGSRFLAAPATLLLAFSGTAVAQWLRLLSSSIPPEAPAARSEAEQAKTE